MFWFIIASGLLTALVAVAVVAAIRRKNAQYWLPAYCSPAQRRATPDPSRPTDVFIAVCDHWEPLSNKGGYALAAEKVERWVREYPRRYGQFRDCDGRPPQHTFFYPQDEYVPAHLDRIGELCRAGFGDVEVHLHHHNDTAAGFEEKLAEFRDVLFHRHGLLRRDPLTGEIVYGFIHGNWSLCNSRPDGALCGVDHELTVLMQTGCYADFTLPSAPNPTQTRIINSIYYAKDIPRRRKSHDYGTLAQVGETPPRDHLLMIQGPLVPDWGRPRFGIVPHIENGDVTAGRAMSMRRLHNWLKADVHVSGQPNWKFVKLHTHGCKDGNIDAWLGDEMLQFHHDLLSMTREQPNMRYHYVTAWEMANLVHRAEVGATEPEIQEPVRKNL